MKKVCFLRDEEGNPKAYKEGNLNYEIVMDKSDFENFWTDVYLNEEKKVGEDLSEYNYRDIDISEIKMDIFNFNILYYDTKPENVEYEKYENIVDGNGYFNIEDVINIANNIKTDSIGIIPLDIDFNAFIKSAINKDYIFLYKEEYYRFLENAKKENNKLYYDFNENDLTELGYNELNRKIEYLKQLKKEYVEKHETYENKNIGDIVVPIWACEDIIVRNVCHWIKQEPKLNRIKNELTLLFKLDKSKVYDQDGLSMILEELKSQENLPIVMNGQERSMNVYDIISILINKVSKNAQKRKSMTSDKFLQLVSPELYEYLIILKNEVERLNQFENKSDEINDRITSLNNCISAIEASSQYYLDDQIVAIKKPSEHVNYTDSGVKIIGNNDYIEDPEYVEEQEFKSKEEMKKIILQKLSLSLVNKNSIHFTDEEANRVRETNAWKNSLSESEKDSIASDLGFSVDNDYGFDTGNSSFTM